MAELSILRGTGTGSIRGLRIASFEAYFDVTRRKSRALGGYPLASHLSPSALSSRSSHTLQMDATFQPSAGTLATAEHFIYVTQVYFCGMSPLL